jgi:hypothetical protein
LFAAAGAAIASAASSASSAAKCPFLMCVPLFLLAPSPGA